MSDTGKSQEPSMEEILASIRRIIAEDEAGRARPGPAALSRSTDAPSRAPRMPNGMAHAPAPQVAAPRAPQGADAGEMVLDLTNMVAADGSVVTIAPTHPTMGRAAPPPAQPQGFATAPAEQPTTVSYSSGFSRRPPPPGPGAEPRAPGFAPPPIPPALQPQPMSFVPQPDSPSRAPQQASTMPVPLPPSLSEDSPSRRVFKRRHTAGSAFAELAQTGFSSPSAHPPSGPAAPQEPPSGFGQVSMGAVATELDMSTPAAHPHSGAPAGFPPADPYMAPAAHPTSGYAQPPAPPSFAADPYVAPAAPAAYAPPPVPQPPPMPPAPAVSEEQIRAAVGAAAEPVIRSWLEANLQRMIEQQLATLVQQQVEQSIASSLPQAVDQRIHQNVETNLGPYIEDRVGAHVDARLAAAVDEKVTAAVKQQVASVVNQQIAQAVTQQIAAAVSQQLQGQQQNVSRLVDDRVKSEIRGLFSRLAGN
jgi:cell pole-organizing protein PopZ